MFEVGDQVVHPMHGAGVVEAIEIRGKGKEHQEYYVLQLSSGNLRVLVPIDKVTQIGVRRIISKDQIPGVFKVLGRDDQEKNYLNWNHRYRANLEKIRTGDVFAVAEVVRTLMRQDQKRNLSSGEKRMLENARQILISELVLAGRMEQEKIELLIKKTVAGG